MSVLAKAKALMINGQYVADCGQNIILPCGNLLNPPVDAWVLRKEACCGNAATQSISMVDPQSTNALKGVYMAWPGYAVVIDALLDDVVTACDACCGAAPVIASQYATIPEFAGDVDTAYTITRLDDGSARALNKAALDYYGQYTEGSFTRVSYNSGTGTSTYGFNASVDPHPLGADVVASETARTFDSNTAPAPGATGLRAEVIADGVQLVDVTAATLATLVTALGASTPHAALGTWTNNSGKVRLTSSNTETASITVTAY